MPRIQVLMPGPLRKVIGADTAVAAQGQTLAEVVDALVGEYPALAGRLRDDSGGLRPFLGFFVNGENVRHLAGPDTAVEDGDQITITQALAGG